MTERVLKIGGFALAALFLLAASKVAVDLLRMLSWEIPGPMHGDAGSYTYTAHAMLNGLTPFVDIFSARPPGIDLLFVASILISGGNALATWVQILTFILTPMLCVLFAFQARDPKTHSSSTWGLAPAPACPAGRLDPERSPLKVGAHSTRLARSGHPSPSDAAASCRASVEGWKTWTLVCVAFIASSLFVLYTEERAGGLQPEGFGYFGSILYAFILLKTQIKSKWSIAAASGALLLSIGMKEPFLLTNLAIALLLSTSWKELPRTFLLPLAIAGIAGVLGLLVIGTLEPYVTLHIPNMLIHRLSVTREWNPIWLRAINTGRIYGSIVLHYPTGKFTGWLIIALSTCAPLLIGQAFERDWTKDKRNWIVMACAAAATLAALRIASYLFFVLYVTKNDPGVRVVFNLQSYVWMAAFAFGILGLLLMRRSLISQVLTVLLIAYITVFAVGAGGAYQPNFFVFAVPVYTALLLLWIDRAASGKAAIPIVGAILILTLVAGFLYRSDPKHVENMRGLLLSQNYASNREDAAHLDALLDACGFDRYVSAVANPAFAHAKHSPWGPLPGLIEPRYMPPDNPYTKKTAHNILKRTQIIIHDDQEWDRPIVNANLATIEERFTEEAPDCAKPHLPFHNYTVLFRKVPQ